MAILTQENLLMKIFFPQKNLSDYSWPVKKDKVGTELNILSVSENIQPKASRWASVCVYLFSKQYSTV